jgi:hypothetical protein
MSKRFVFIDDEIFLSPSTFRVLESLQKDASTTILLDLKMEQRAREAIKEQQKSIETLEHKIISIQESMNGF